MPVLETIHRHLDIDTDARLNIYARVSESASSSLTYWLEILFSAGIATLGLVLNSPAVVIGAMLISPLMGPIIAAGLSLAAGDLYLGLKSMLTIAASMAVAVGFSAWVVWLMPFHAPTSEILARTQPNLLDLGVALLSGMAGSFVVCRKSSGSGASALPGVAIAVALMPPLCTVGFGVGSGGLSPIMKGAGLLFLTNLAAIVASAFGVFLLIRMDSRDLRQRIDYGILERASTDRLYNLLKTTSLGRAFGDVGRWYWRGLMLLAVLAILFVPLRTGLIQVRDEITSRNAVREEMTALAPRDSVVSQGVDISPDAIVARLIVTRPVDPARVDAAERNLLRRTGKSATVLVQRVADEKELAVLRERLGAPPPAPPPPPADLDTLRNDILSRVEQPLRNSWPSATAELAGFEVSLTPVRSLVRATYRADRAISPDVQTVLTQVLRSALGRETIDVELIRETPPPVKLTRMRPRP